MNPHPLVSVILPAYNGAKTIESAVDSVFAQNYTNYEFLVVDDASTDDTVPRLKRYGDRIRLIELAQNSGICELARQEAIQVASGKYLALLDQDDLWAPDKLHRQVAFMEAHPEYPLSHHYVRVIDQEGQPFEIRHEGKIPPSGACARELLRHCFLTASSIMVTPMAWQIGIQAHRNKNSNADIEQFLTIHKHFPAGFGFIPEVLGAYRRWNQSMSRQDWRWGPEDVNALERVYSGNYWNGVMPKREARKLLCEAYRTNAEYHRQAGYPSRALYFARRGLRHHWLDIFLWTSFCLAAIQSLIAHNHE